MCFGGTCKYKFEIKGDPPRECANGASSGAIFTITKDGFGFDEECYEPEAVRGDLSIIKFKDPNRDPYETKNNISFWVKRIDEEVYLHIFFHPIVN